MTTIFRAAVFVGALLGLSGPGLGATLSVTDFSVAAYELAVGGLGPSVSEDFEGFSEGNVADGWAASSVGAFSTLGGTGSGGTVTASLAKGNFAGNDGSRLALRDGNVYGRSSTSAALSGVPGAGVFLDSNDTYGIEWEASLGGTLFDRIVLTLSDAADVGRLLRITAGGMETTLSGLSDGNIRLIDIVLDTPVAATTLLFSVLDDAGNPARNDGFSIDDITLGQASLDAPAVVPLPASGWALLGGLGIFAAMRVVASHPVRLPTFRRRPLRSRRRVYRPD